jgi:hypothetical protein
VEVLGACTSYEASDFDATCRVYEHVLGLEDGLAVTLMVDDAGKAPAEIEERGGVADRALVVSDWSRHFGVRDPDGVRVWIMERLVE